MLRRAEAIVDAAIPVIGHIGLTPQSVKLLGGYKPQGCTAVKARRLVDAARRSSGRLFAVVLEAIPPQVAAFITKTLSIPTIGIGAGARVGRPGAGLARSDGALERAAAEVREAGTPTSARHARRA